MSFGVQSDDPGSNPGSDTPKGEFPSPTHNLKVKKMVKLKVTLRGESVPLEVDDEMRSATDEQIIGYAREQFPDLDPGEMRVERTPEGLSVFPSPVYGD